MSPHQAPYRPIAPEAWGRLIAYLQQAEAHLVDATAPEPDTALLVAEDQGPLREVTAGLDSFGNPVVYFRCGNPDLKPRYAPPQVFMMLRFLLAFGGGCSSNDNGKGWAYVRPFSGNDRAMLLRLVADAKAGEVVKQHEPSGRRTDFRSQDPLWITIVKVPRYGEEAGRPTRTPGSDRETAIATALGVYRRNSRHSHIETCGEAYGAILRRAFAVIDAVYSRPT